jgi:hypothetical protein
MSIPETGNEPLVLLPEDHEFLRQSYVHYSGTIYLAGGEILLKEGTGRLILPFPGTYRVNTSAAIMIDGRPTMNGDVIGLDRPELSITGKSGTDVQLIWDTGVELAPGALPNRSVYAPFWNLFK